MINMLTITPIKNRSHSQGFDIKSTIFILSHIIKSTLKQVCGTIQAKIHETNQKP